jgi:hypothetical protein
MHLLCCGWTFRNEVKGSNSVTPFSELLCLNRPLAEAQMTKTPLHLLCSSRFSCLCIKTVTPSNYMLTRLQQLQFVAYMKFGKYVCLMHFLFLHVNFETINAFAFVCECIVYFTTSLFCKVFIFFVLMKKCIHAIWDIFLECVCILLMFLRRER